MNPLADVRSPVSTAYLVIRIRCVSSHKERTLKELQWFIDHKVKQVKFVDRTFNCAPHHHRPLMEFMRDSRYRDELPFGNGTRAHDGVGNQYSL